MKLHFAIGFVFCICCISYGMKNLDYYNLGIPSLLHDFERSFSMPLDCSEYL